MSLLFVYSILLAAVICEVIGTSALLASQQFTRPVPTVLVVVFYSAALVGISVAFRVIPMGIVYGLWSGLGIVLIAGVGWLVFGQRLDLAGTLGLIDDSRRRDGHQRLLEVVRPLTARTCDIPAPDVSCACAYAYGRMDRGRPGV